MLEKFPHSFYGTAFKLTWIKLTTDPVLCEGWYNQLLQADFEVQEGVFDTIRACLGWNIAFKQAEADFLLLQLILTENIVSAPVTCVLSGATPQQVAELLAAFTLAVTPWGVEAQLLHQHQRLLTQVFIPVPRHPPIRIALSPAVSQWQQSRHRPHL